MTAPQMKRCSKCRRYKPVHQFNKNRRKKDGLQGNCRECQKEIQREWYSKPENKARHLKKVGKNNKKQRRHRRMYALARLTACVDCGETDKVVLDFDHVRGKKIDNISNMVRLAVPVKKLQAEIDKCDVVCANCHRKRTASRDPRHWMHKKKMLAIVADMENASVA